MDQKNKERNQQALNDLRARAMQVTEALYRTTDLFSDAEPLKWSLRDSAVKILNIISDINSQPTYQELRGIQMVEKMIESLCYKLDLAVGGTFVARSNFDILEREYRLLNEKINHSNFATTILIDDVQQNKDKTHSKRDILNIPSKRTLIVQKSPIDSGMSDINKEEQAEAFPESKMNIQAMPISAAQNEINNTHNSNVYFKENTSSSSSVLSDRKGAILQFIKERGPSSVGEMRKLIDMSLSDKTIQRDLNAMAEAGILRREGEKRWRRYFL